MRSSSLASLAHSQASFHPFLGHARVLWQIVSQVSARLLREEKLIYRATCALAPFFCWLFSPSSCSVILWLQENLEQICGKVIVLPNDLHNPSLFQKCVCMVLFANSQYTYICSWMSSPGNYIIASMRTREPQDSCAAVLMLYSLF